MPDRATIQPNDPANGPQPPDLELLARAREGNAAAFRSLTDRYAQPLFRLAVSLVGNSFDAEDVLQETLIGAYRGMGRFEGRSSVKTWLTRILVTQAAKSRRDRKRRRGSAELVDAPAGGSGPGGVGAAMDVQAALAQLTMEHRQVLVLREFDGLSYEEMAEVLEVPRGTVESRLHRARAELKLKLQSYSSDGIVDR